MSKYRNKKSYCRQGHLHDSRKEADRCDELHLLKRAGKITDLEIQKKFVLIPAQFEFIENYSKKTGKRLKDKKKCVEREVSYYADFVYNENGERIVEDCKGERTKEYIIKRKLMLYMNNIKIKET